MPTPSDRPELRREIVRRLQDLTTESRHVAQSFSAQQGLSHTDLDALLFVMRQQTLGEPTTPGAIADSLGLTSGAATGVVDRLERQGHVERHPDAHDRRITRVHYAEHARAVAHSFFAPLGDLTDEVMSNYSTADLATVTRFLAEMSQAMGQHAAQVARRETEGSHGLRRASEVPSES